ncbi:MAG: N-6 DNA methylase [Patescibacteria group bacterium]|nr:N-6 DNA methylase [Patescibacteria group bacterium]
MSTIYEPQKEKVISEPEEYLKLGQSKGYFALGDKKIKYLAIGKKYNFSDPEEKVRAEYYFDLIEKYNYPAKRIELEVEMPDRTPERYADIVIYKDDEQKIPYIVVECKKDGITDAEFEQATKQAIANARILKAPFAICVAGNTRRALETEKWNDKTPEKAIITDIPISYGKIEEFRYKKGDPNWDLKVLDKQELIRALKKSHDTLWAGGKRNPTVAFDELAKIIFVKIRDEKKGRKDGEYYDFQIKTHEPAESVFQRIDGIYQEAKEKDPEVFKESLKVDPEELYTVVEHLQSLSLNKTDLDTKGVAFEQFMEDFFKGKSGQYFTPREIVNFAIKMMDIKNDDLVLDPACGSGGFLLHALDKVRNDAEEYFGSDEAEKYRYWHNFAANNLFGIEINDSIARVAKMNMIIHDDGHTNVIGFDALEDIDKMNRKNPGFDNNRFDIIVTNPPFGANVKASEHPYLEKFFFGKKINKDGKERNMKNQKTEVLFIERCVNFLKLGVGQMAIVLPDGILTNSSLQYVRDYLMEKTQILAVVSLPQFAFTHFGAGVKSSLVFVRKKEENEKLGKYPIFMAIAEHIGYDATGRKDAKNDLDKICEEFKKFKSLPR